MSTDTGSRFDGGALRAGLGLGDPRRLLRGAAGVVGFVVVWHLVSLTQPAFVLPSPLAVGDAFAEELASGTMTTALASSVRHSPGAASSTT